MTLGVKFKLRDQAPLGGSGAEATGGCLGRTSRNMSLQCIVSGFCFDISDETLRSTAGAYEFLAGAV